MMLFTVAIKTLKEAVRQPKNLGLALGLPVVFMLIFGFAFGESEAQTFRIAVLDEDEGALGARYVDGLRNLTYGDGTALVVVTVVGSEEDGRAAVEGRGAQHAFLRIPANFSANLRPPAQPNPGPLGGIGGPQGPPPMPPGARVEVWGDPSKPAFNGASQVVTTYTQAFSERASGRGPLVRVDTNVVVSEELTSFDFIAPGLMIFAVLNLAPQAAAVLAREAELRTLDRLRASPTRAGSFLGGVAVAQLVIASASMGLMLATARVMGFDNQGSYALAFGIIMASAAAVVGIGLVIAAFARTQQEAANLGIMVSVPASFLSGAFFELPAVRLFSWRGEDVGLYDALPTTHAVEAIRSVMTFGRGVDAVEGALAALAALGLLYLAVGIVLYRRMRLAAE